MTKNNSRPFSIRVRVAAAFTAVVFASTSVAWAVPVPALPWVIAPVYQKRIEKFEIPSELGTVKSWRPSAAASSPTIILIEDAHAQFQAQLKIKEILSYLQENENIRTAFVEGAAAPLDAGKLRFFDDPELNIKIAEALAEKGELTGVELFILSARVEYKVFGVEDLRLYADNLSVFREVLKRRVASGRFVETLRREIARVIGQNLPKDLRTFLNHVMAYEESRLSLFDFLPFLKTAADSTLKVDLLDPKSQVYWPQLVRLTNLQDIERTMNRKTIEAELNKAAAFLNEAGIDSSMLMSLQAGRKTAAEQSQPHDFVFLRNRGQTLRRSYEEFYGEAKKAGFDFSLYPALRDYVANRIFQTELDGIALEEEISTLTDKVLEKLGESPEEKAIVSAVRDIRLTDKAFALSLSREEASAFKNRRADLEPAAIASRILSLRGGVPPRRQGIPKRTASAAAVLPRRPRSETPRLRSVFEKVIEFYALADKREDALVANMLHEIEKGNVKKAVLIAGGFHTHGLMHLLEKKNISYAVVMPRIPEIETSRDNYYRVVAGIKPKSTGKSEVVQAIFSGVSRQADVFSLYDGGEEVWKARASESARIIAEKGGVTLEEAERLLQRIRFGQETRRSRGILPRINSAGRDAPSTRSQNLSLRGREAPEAISDRSEIASPLPGTQARKDGFVLLLEGLSSGPAAISAELRTHFESVHEAAGFGICWGKTVDTIARNFVQIDTRETVGDFLEDRLPGFVTKKVDVPMFQALFKKILLDRYPGTAWDEIRKRKDIPKSELQAVVDEAKRRFEEIIVVNNDFSDELIKEVSEEFPEAFEDFIEERKAGQDEQLKDAAHMISHAVVEEVMIQDLVLKMMNAQGEPEISLEKAIPLLAKRLKSLKTFLYKDAVTEEMIAQVLSRASVSAQLARLLHSVTRTFAIPKEKEDAVKISPPAKSAARPGSVQTQQNTNQQTHGGAAPTGFGAKSDQPTQMALLLEQFLNEVIAEKLGTTPEQVKSGKISVPDNVRKEALGEANRRLQEALNPPPLAPDEEEIGKLPPFFEDLTELARQGKLRKIFYRDQVVSDIAAQLSKKKNASVMMIADPGAGKTAVAQLLAQKMASSSLGVGRVDGARLLSLKVEVFRALAGATIDSFSTAVIAFLEEAKKPNTFVFIDEFHKLAPGQNVPGSTDSFFSSLLAPLEIGEVRIIAATTKKHFNTYIKMHDDLMERFGSRPFELVPLTPEQSKRALREIRVDIEKHYNEGRPEGQRIHITEEAITAAVDLTEELEPWKVLVRKAEDAIDNAASIVTDRASRSRSTLVALKEDLTRELNYLHEAYIRGDESGIQAGNKAVSDTTSEIMKLKFRIEGGFSYTVGREDIIEGLLKSGIPKHRLDGSTQKILETLAEDLKKVVLGQDELIDPIADEIAVSYNSKQRGAPLGSFWIDGATGTGKTEIARQIAIRLMGAVMKDGSEDPQFIKINAGEYDREHKVDKLFGSPPGYLGYRPEGGELLQKVKKNPYSVILIDEADKAHPSFFDRLLGIVDGGYTTAPDGSYIDFTQTVIIFTSNLGFQGDRAQELMKELSVLWRERMTLLTEGAAPQSQALKEIDHKIAALKSEYQERSRGAKEALIAKEIMRTEFWNKLTIAEPLVANPISPELMQDIVAKVKLPQFERAYGREKIEITYTDRRAVIEFLMDQGYDARLGARPLNRAIREFLMRPITRFQSRGKLAEGDKIVVGLTEDKKKITVEHRPGERKSKLDIELFSNVASAQNILVQLRDRVISTETWKPFTKEELDGLLDEKPENLAATKNFHPRSGPPSTEKTKSPESRFQFSDFRPGNGRKEIEGFLNDILGGSGFGARTKPSLRGGETDEARLPGGQAISAQFRKSLDIITTGIVERLKRLAANQIAKLKNGGKKIDELEAGGGANLPLLRSIYEEAGQSHKVIATSSPEEGALILRFTVPAVLSLDEESLWNTAFQHDYTDINEVRRDPALKDLQDLAKVKLAVNQLKGEIGYEKHDDLRTTIWIKFPFIKTVKSSPSNPVTAETTAEDAPGRPLTPQVGEIKKSAEAPGENLGREPVSKTETPALKDIVTALNTFWPTQARSGRLSSLINDIPPRFSVNVPGLAQVVLDTLANEKKDKNLAGKLARALEPVIQIYGQESGKAIVTAVVLDAMKALNAGGLMPDSARPPANFTAGFGSELSLRGPAGAEARLPGGQAISNRTWSAKTRDLIRQIRTEGSQEKREELVRKNIGNLREWMYILFGRGQRQVRHDSDGYDHVYSYVSDYEDKIVGSLTSAFSKTGVIVEDVKRLHDMWKLTWTKGIFGEWRKPDAKADLDENIHEGKRVYESHVLPYMLANPQPGAVLSATIHEPRFLSFFLTALPDDIVFQEDATVSEIDYVVRNLHESIAFVNESNPALARNIARLLLTKELRGNKRIWKRAKLLRFDKFGAWLDMTFWEKLFVGIKTGDGESFLELNLENIAKLLTQKETLSLHVKVLVDYIEMPSVSKETPAINKESIRKALRQFWPKVPRSKPLSVLFEGTSSIMPLENYIDLLLSVFLNKSEVNSILATASSRIPLGLNEQESARLKLIFSDGIKSENNSQLSGELVDDILSDTFIALAKAGFIPAKEFAGSAGFGSEAEEPIVTPESVREALEKFWPKQPRSEPLAALTDPGKRPLVRIASLDDLVKAIADLLGNEEVSTIIEAAKSRKPQGLNETESNRVRSIFSDELFSTPNTSIPHIQPLPFEQAEEILPNILSDIFITLAHAGFIPPPRSFVDDSEIVELEKKKIGEKAITTPFGLRALEELSRSGLTRKTLPSQTKQEFLADVGSTILRISYSRFADEDELSSAKVELVNFDTNDDRIMGFTFSYDSLGFHISWDGRSRRRTTYLETEPKDYQQFEGQIKKKPFGLVYDKTKRIVHIILWDEVYDVFKKGKLLESEAIDSFHYRIWPLSRWERRQGKGFGASAGFGAGKNPSITGESIHKALKEFWPKVPRSRNFDDLIDKTLMSPFIRGDADFSVTIALGLQNEEVRRILEADRTKIPPGLTDIEGEQIRKVFLELLLSTTLSEYRPAFGPSYFGSHKEWASSILSDVFIALAHAGFIPPPKSFPDAQMESPAAVSDEALTASINRLGPNDTDEETRQAALKKIRELLPQVINRAIQEKVVLNQAQFDERVRLRESLKVFEDQAVPLESGLQVENGAILFSRKGAGETEVLIVTEVSYQGAEKKYPYIKLNGWRNDGIELKTESKLFDLLKGYTFLSPSDSWALMMNNGKVPPDGEILWPLIRKHYFSVTGRAVKPEEINDEIGVLSLWPGAKGGEAWPRTSLVVELIRALENALPYARPMLPGDHLEPGAIYFTGEGKFWGLGLGVRTVFETSLLILDADQRRKAFTHKEVEDLSLQAVDAALVEKFLSAMSKTGEPSGQVQAQVALEKLYQLKAENRGIEERLGPFRWKSLKKALVSAFPEALSLESYFAQSSEPLFIYSEAGGPLGFALDYQKSTKPPFDMELVLTDGSRISERNFDSYRAITIERLREILYGDRAEMDAVKARIVRSLELPFDSRARTSWPTIHIAVDRNRRIIAAYQEYTVYPSPEGHDPGMDRYIDEYLQPRKEGELYLFDMDGKKIPYKREQGSAYEVYKSGRGHYDSIIFDAGGSITGRKTRTVSDLSALASAEEIDFWIGRSGGSSKGFGAGKNPAVTKKSIGEALTKHWPRVPRSMPLNDMSPYFTNKGNFIGAIYSAMTDLQVVTAITESRKRSPPGLNNEESNVLRRVVGNKIKAWSIVKGETLEPLIPDILSDIFIALAHAGFIPAKTIASEIEGPVSRKNDGEIQGLSNDLRIDTKLPGGIESPIFSPDDEYVAATFNNGIGLALTKIDRNQYGIITGIGELLKWSPEGKLYPMGMVPPRISAPAFISNGKYIMAWGDEGKSLLFFPLKRDDAGKIVEILDPIAVAMNVDKGLPPPKLTPDGYLIATAKNSTALVFFKIEQNELGEIQKVSSPVEVKHSAGAIEFYDVSDDGNYIFGQRKYGHVRRRNEFYLEIIRGEKGGIKGVSEPNSFSTIEDRIVAKSPLSIGDDVISVWDSGTILWVSRIVRDRKGKIEQVEEKLYLQPLNIGRSYVGIDTISNYRFSHDGQYLVAQYVEDGSLLFFKLVREDAAESATGEVSDDNKKSLEETAVADLARLLAQLLAQKKNARTVTVEPIAVAVSSDGRKAAIAVRSGSTEKKDGQRVADIDPAIFFLDVRTNTVIKIYDAARVISIRSLEFAGDELNMEIGGRKYNVPIREVQDTEEGFGSAGESAVPLDEQLDKAFREAKETWSAEPEADLAQWLKTDFEGRKIFVLAELYGSPGTVKLMESQLLPLLKSNPVDWLFLTDKVVNEQFFLRAQRSYPEIFLAEDLRRIVGAPREMVIYRKYASEVVERALALLPIRGIDKNRIFSALLQDVFPIEIKDGSPSAKVDSAIMIKFAKDWKVEEAYLWERMRENAANLLRDAEAFQNNFRTIMSAYMAVAHAMSRQAVQEALKKHENRRNIFVITGIDHRAVFENLADTSFFSSAGFGAGKFPAVTKKSIGEALTKHWPRVPRSVPLNNMLAWYTGRGDFIGTIYSAMTDPEVVTAITLSRKRSPPGLNNEESDVLRRVIGNEIKEWGAFLGATFEPLIPDILNDIFIALAHGGFIPVKPLAQDLRADEPAEKTQTNVLPFSEWPESLAERLKEAPSLQKLFLKVVSQATPNDLVSFISENWGQVGFEGLTLSRPMMVTTRQDKRENGIYFKVRFKMNADENEFSLWHQGPKAWEDLLKSTSYARRFFEGELLDILLATDDEIEQFKSSTAEAKVLARVKAFFERKLAKDDLAVLSFLGPLVDNARSTRPVVVFHPDGKRAVVAVSIKALYAKDETVDPREARFESVLLVSEDSVIEIAKGTAAAVNGFDFVDDGKMLVGFRNHIPVLQRVIRSKKDATGFGASAGFGAEALSWADVQLAFERYWPKQPRSVPWNDRSKLIGGSIINETQNLLNDDRIRSIVKAAWERKPQGFNETEREIFRQSFAQALRPLLRPQSNPEEMLSDLLSDIFIALAHGGFIPVKPLEQDAKLQPADPSEISETDRKTSPLIYTDIEPLVRSFIQKEFGGIGNSSYFPGDMFPLVKINFVFDPVVVLSPNKRRAAFAAKTELVYAEDDAKPPIKKSEWMVFLVQKVSRGKKVQVKSIGRGNEVAGMSSMRFSADSNMLFGSNQAGIEFFERAFAPLQDQTKGFGIADVSPRIDRNSLVREGRLLAEDATRKIYAGPEEIQKAVWRELGVLIDKVDSARLEEALGILEKFDVLELAQLTRSRGIPKGTAPASAVLPTRAGIQKIGPPLSRGRQAVEGGVLVISPRYLERSFIQQLRGFIQSDDIVRIETTGQKPGDELKIADIMSALKKRVKDISKLPSKITFNAVLGREAVSDIAVGGVVTPGAIAAGSQDETGAVIELGEEFDAFKGTPEQGDELKARIYFHLLHASRVLRGLQGVEFASLRKQIEDTYALRATGPNGFLQTTLNEQILNILALARLAQKAVSQAA